MANQFANVANALAILKNYYAGPIVSQFNDDYVKMVAFLRK